MQLQRRIFVYWEFSWGHHDTQAGRGILAFTNHLRLQHQDRDLPDRRLKHIVCWKLQQHGENLQQNRRLLHLSPKHLGGLWAQDDRAEQRENGSQWFIKPNKILLL